MNDDQNVPMTPAPEGDAPMAAPSEEEMKKVGEEMGAEGVEVEPAV